LSRSRAYRSLPRGLLALLPGSVPNHHGPTGRHRFPGGRPPPWSRLDALPRRDSLRWPSTGRQTAPSLTAQLRVAVPKAASRGIIRAFVLRRARTGVQPGLRAAPSLGAYKGSPAESSGFRRRSDSIAHRRPECRERRSPRSNSRTTRGSSSSIASSFNAANGVALVRTVPSARFQDDGTPLFQCRERRSPRSNLASR
jgi:hypothetical protein